MSKIRHKLLQPITTLAELSGLFET